MPTISLRSILDTAALDLLNVRPENRLTIAKEFLQPDFAGNLERALDTNGSDSLFMNFFTLVFRLLPREKRAAFAEDLLATPVMVKHAQKRPQEFLHDFKIIAARLKPADRTRLGIVEDYLPPIKFRHPDGKSGCLVHIFSHALPPLFDVGPGRVATAAGLTKIWEADGAKYNLPRRALADSLQDAFDHAAVAEDLPRLEVLYEAIRTLKPRSMENILMGSRNAHDDLPAVAESVSKKPNAESNLWL